MSVFDRLPIHLKDKLNQCVGLRGYPDTYQPNSTEVRFREDHFTPRGFPKLSANEQAKDAVFSYLFPFIAPWYDGAFFPEEVVTLAPEFGDGACMTGLQYLYDWMDGANFLVPDEDNDATFNGLAFQEEFNGTKFTFCFPDTTIRTKSHGTAAIVLIPDSYWNNANWEKQGSVPLYARQIALFQLWCWNRYAEKCTDYLDVPEIAFIVRVCGNLPTDCFVRTVAYNPQEAEMLVARICKAKAQEPQKGLYWKRKFEKRQSYEEKIENDAFIIEDADLHALVVQFMKEKAGEAALSQEIKSLTNREEALEVHIGSLIPAGNIQGTYALPDGTICTATHQQCRHRASSLSAATLLALFPELGNCTDTGAPRRYFSANTL